MKDPGPIPGDLSPLAARAFDAAAARHLLNRAGFGGTPAQVDALAALGLDRAVDLLVEYETQPGEPVTPDDFDRDLMPPLGREEREQLATARRERDEEAVERLERKENQARAADRRQLAELKKWWLRRMIETARPLEEKMTLFWHGHFATGARTVENSWHMFQQNHLFRTHATGNFATLALNVIRDPAMLRYLDNNQSRRGRPNENLARELLELFILGEGNGYTEADIKAGARALTGYTYDDDDFAFRRQNHEDGPKEILGQRGNWNGDDFARLALGRTESSGFLCGKLYRYLVNDTPGEDLPEAHRRAAAATVGAMARQLRDAQYDLKPVLARLFRSAHFHHPANRGTLIKSPVQAVVQTVRQFGTPPRRLSALVGACDLMGQDLFQPPNVKGWDGGRAWINTATMFVRQNVAVYLLTGRRPDIYDWELDERAFDATPLVAGATGPEEVADRLLGLALAAPAHPERRAAIARFLAAQPSAASNASVVAALSLVTALPEYQLA